MDIKFSSVACSDVGLKRKINQDAIYVDDQQGLWIVADGMGGHSEGEKASRAIIETLQNIQLSQLLSQRLVQLEKALRQVNADLQHYANTQLNDTIIGSTVVLFTVCQGYGVFLWAGDSRIYRYTNSTLKHLNWDHNHLEEQKRMGVSAKDCEVNERYNAMLTRAIGAHENIYFDQQLVRTLSGTFLICSDGLTGELTDNHISQVLETHNKEQSLQVLLNDVLASGAKDNVSIILLTINQKDQDYTDQAKSSINITNSNLQKLANNSVEPYPSIDLYYQYLAKIYNKLGKPIFANDWDRTTPIINRNIGHNSHSAADINTDRSTYLPIKSLKKIISYSAIAIFILIVLVTQLL